MSVKFDSIDVSNDKVNRIINSAFKVFSKNDFEKASTALVVKDAGISRGLLYHYFTNKQELFEYIQYFAYHIVYESMAKEINWKNDDVFERLSKSMKIKLELINDYPYVFNFFNRYPNLVTPEKKKRYKAEEHNKARESFYSENVDHDALKDNIDFDSMLAVSRYTIKGVFNKHIDNHDFEIEELDIDKIMKDIEHHIDFLRKVFYK